MTAEDVVISERLYFCPRCQMKYPKGHAHVTGPRPPGMWDMIRKHGSCGCWKLRVQCQECGKLLCGKNGAHCVRLTKNNVEAPNGQKKFCVDCGLKIRRGDK